MTLKQSVYYILSILKEIKLITFYKTFSLYPIQILCITTATNAFSFLLKYVRNIAKVGIFSFLGISYIMVSHRKPGCYSPIVTTTPFTPGLSGLYQEYIQNGVRLFLSENIKRRRLIFKTVHKLFSRESDWTDLLPGNIIP